MAPPLLHAEPTDAARFTTTKSLLTVSGCLLDCVWFETPQPPSGRHVYYCLPLPHCHPHSTISRSFVTFLGGSALLELMLYIFFISLLFNCFENILKNLLSCSVVFIVMQKFVGSRLEVKIQIYFRLITNSIRDKAYQALQTLILVITQMNRGKIYKLGLSLCLDTPSSTILS